MVLIVEITAAQYYYYYYYTGYLAHVYTKSY